MTGEEQFSQQQQHVQRSRGRKDIIAMLRQEVSELGEQEAGIPGES